MPLDPLNTERLSVLALVGPTGVGKTDLAEDLAVTVGAEIVSADAMQVYRGMDIGTAKPHLHERRVRYHCVDLVDPGETYSAALYQRDARHAIDACLARSVLPLVCGGTGLYVRAALDDLSFPPGEQDENPIRRRYERIAAERGPEALHAHLAERDPKSATLIHPHNVRRVVRALEMLDRGTSYESHASRFRERRSVYDVRFLGLTMERQPLYERIEQRVDTMVAAGLLDEVERLLSSGFRAALTSTQAIGYKELVPVVEGRATLDSAVAQIKLATRRYAKRQLTWFKADPRITWIDVTSLTPSERLAAALEALR